ncbi:ATP-binding protein [Micromonospora sp. WMMD956]|uniref:ATP-binding protein n=1 Tax=Micromonospora sp. WMMD956 TaxID=3016108 RepID=UPI00241749CD|nr:ATP-binding protein [Micromonospora sp. WMMD956]MDG4814690.1 ATP-binding protein [Micromonospora sp. WMMD956]
MLEELTIKEYGLYPGTSKHPGVRVTFKPGLTLVLGANGLGKTTLVTIMYRMLTGGHELPNMVAGREFGNRTPEARSLSRIDRRVFADRVIDDAAGATAALTFRLGRSSFRVSRSLHDLSIRSFTIDDEEQDASDTAYQAAIQDHANVPSFGDMIFLLRHLTFYFEDRRALVWDASAQRQLLRLLFLDRETAKQQASKEREIFTLDSSVRNLQYAIGREEKRAARTEKVIGSADEVRQKLQLLQGIQEDELEQLAELEEALAIVEARRQQARVNALTAEQAQESALRAVERQQLSMIRNSFPSASETARYLVGHIVANQSCLVCQSDVPGFAADLQARVLERRCVVCNSNITERTVPRQRTNRTLTKALKDLEAAETQATAAVGERDASEAEYDARVSIIAELTARTANRAVDIDNLIKRLPPSDKAVHEHRTYLSTMRAGLAADRQKLESLRDEFGMFAARINRDIASRKEEIKRAFRSFATDFLLEGCELVWAPRKGRLGETGGLVDFPAFELEMTGTDYHSAVRRSGPQQVSESQREFIDLAFRMALMQVATEGGTTMVIDAPESSLDAVFVARAADVLTRYGEPSSGNRLLITSNLVEGDLIPALLRNAGIQSSRDERVVDLLAIATPTAATEQLHEQYQEVRTRIFARARAPRD